MYLYLVSFLLWASLPGDTTRKLFNINPNPRFLDELPLIFNSCPVTKCALSTPLISHEGQGARRTKGPSPSQVRRIFILQFLDHLLSQRAHPFGHVLCGR